MIRIPLLQLGTTPSPAYLATLKTAINSDGCTKAPDIYGCCCILHDLAYRFGINHYGEVMRKADADHLLESCMESQSRLKRFSIIARIYYGCVRAFGAWAYAGDVDTRPAYETYPWVEPVPNRL